MVVSDHSGHDCCQHKHAFQAFAKNENGNIEHRRKLAGVFSCGIGAASRRNSLPKKHSHDEKCADHEKNRKNSASHRGEKGSRFQSDGGRSLQSSLNLRLDLTSVKLNIRPKGERVGEIAAKAAVQLLFSTGKSFTVDGLREKLREFFRQEVRAELRAVAALSNVELITALLSCNRQLALVGLQLRIINGVVSLLTTEVHNRALAAYLSEQTRASANSGLTTATLEVLACIAFKQPISQTEIDHLFDADKRGLVVTLRDLRLVEEFAGTDGRLRFATTQTFLQRFGLASLQELAAASFLASPPATQPLI